MRKIYWWTAEIISGLLIVLFVYTAVSKLLTFRSFQVVLSMSPVIGNYSAWLAWLLPAVEIITAALLFFPSTKRLGLLVSFVLLLGFTGYVFYMLHSGYHLPCTCGGVLKRLSWQEHLLFNAACTTVAGAGLLLHYRTKDVIAINRSSRIPV